VDSPTDWAIARIWSGVTTKPHSRIWSAAFSTVPPSDARGALIEKYNPGSSAVAAQSAMIATNDSVSMPP
jgi:hypothetical protein